MSTFTLAISCLTTSNLPWYMNLTFQIPMQYCSLQHRILLLSWVPPTAGCCLYFGSIPSFFLELFLHWSPVAYWVPTSLGSSSSSVLSFCLIILFMGFSRQEYWFAIPFSSGPHSVRSLQHDPSVLGGPTWHGLVPLSLTSLVHVTDWLVVCDCGFSLSAFWCPLSVPTILLGFLLPWTVVSLYSYFSKPQPLLLTSDVG